MLGHIQTLNRLNLKSRDENHGSFYLIKSFITSEAIINPATEGTKAMLAGSLCPLCLIGGSCEYTTLSFFTPRFFNSCLITLAKGQTDVL